MKMERFLDFGDILCSGIEKKYPNLGYFGRHPINEKLDTLGVRLSEVKWIQPKRFECQDPTPSGICGGSPHCT